MRNKIFVEFSLSPNVGLSPYKINMIENDERENNSKYEYFTGIAYEVTGQREHFCDCDYCDMDYEDISEMFTSKEEAENYVKENEMFDSSIRESGYYKKAVRQNPANFGLFKEVRQ